MKITTNVLDLFAIVSDATVFATKVPDNPRISGAALERHNGLLLSIATDRFRFGVSSAPAGFDGPDDWHIWIPYDEIKQLHATVKGYGSARARATMPVTITDQNGTVTFELPGQTVSFEAQQSTLPDWRELFARTNPTGSTATFNPGYLKDFGRITPRGEGTRAIVTVGAGTTPTRVEIGDYFMGLLMPVNPDGITPLYSRLMGGTQ
ncbi:hypothetical protein KUG88_28110 [Rhodococcus rhodochrous]|uniref:hypothetical protein n=1 Tax=Rhodococcus rhodochrous TaxID=1829 RepID=UPI001E2E1ADF|nr:hypothetical protein [Rhodococcus rhodochrous]MCB8913969.1 hypothetical protein [Rhodococcus rhodochrous]